MRRGSECLLCYAHTCFGIVFVEGEFAVRHLHVLVVAHKGVSACRQVEARALVYFEFARRHRSAEQLGGAVHTLAVAAHGIYIIFSVAQRSACRFACFACIFFHRNFRR